MSKIESLLDKKAVAEFWKFVKERQMVWYRRYILNKDPPWTKDEVLNNYKFTNVYRMLDRGTLHLHNVIYPSIEEYVDGDEKTLNKLIFLNTVLYRIVNRIETFEGLIEQEEQPLVVSEYLNPSKEIARLRKAFYKYRESGGTIFTNAHMVASLSNYSREDGSKDWEKDTKINRVLNGFEGTIDRVEDLVVEVLEAESGEDAFNAMRGCAPQMGHFVTYEVWCDLIYTPLLSRFNEDSFVNVGPGAYRGLNALAAETPLSNKNAIKVLYWLRENQAEYLEGFPFFTFPKYRVPGLSLRCVEHSLCEYFKIWKKRNDEGRPRNPYRVNEDRKEQLAEATNSYLDLLNSGLTSRFKVIKE